MLTSKNFLHSYLSFEDRQAGVCPVYCRQNESYHYHGYCLERKLLKDLLSVEFSLLDDALCYINEEFSTWKLESFSSDKGCGSCHAK